MESEAMSTEALENEQLDDGAISDKEFILDFGGAASQFFFFKNAFIFYF